MAGLIATALIGKVFDASEGEQAFQTWWDNAKHFLLYGNILLGKKFVYQSISRL
jgi:hypothetical protein